jgi:SAM-dependent methyltransferase
MRTFRRTDGKVARSVLQGHARPPVSDTEPIDRSALRYDARLADLSPRLRECFLELAPDSATEAYLASAAPRRHGRVRTLAHRALRHLLSDFDVNGLLDMYPMHLLGTEQWRALLGAQTIPRALDVGAGAGDVTAQLAPLCTSIEATETSPAMIRRLNRRGIASHELDLTTDERLAGPFDLISCLNVLDRCARPLTLLKRLHALLAEDGRLVLALALPYNPFYYVGASTPEPEERLACDAATWERGAERLAGEVCEPLGFRVQRVSRMPYLSGGDAHAPLYVLDDVVMVLRKR